MPRTIHPGGMPRKSFHPQMPGTATGEVRLPHPRMGGTQSAETGVSSECPNEKGPHLRASRSDIAGAGFEPATFGL
jgi:hypothetical protein